jgi:hypothetical protein
MYGPRPGRNSLLDRPIDVVSHSHEIDFGSTQLLAESEIMSRATKQIWQDISIYIYIYHSTTVHMSVLLVYVRIRTTRRRQTAKLKKLFLQTMQVIV